jgi:2-hydroxy-3-oxopropionate reductase
LDCITHALYYSGHTPPLVEAVRSDFVVKRLGFIGLGKMGKPMAKNLLRSGFPLTVYNRSQPPIDDLVKEGAASALTPKEVGSRSEIVFLSLPSTQAVHEVVLSEVGVGCGMKRGGVIIDTSTIDPQSTREISGELRELGLRFLDAPVSGGPEAAETATLTFMIGGDETTLNACRDVFDVLGRNLYHMGSNGAGQSTKLVNQLLVTTHTLATAEAMTFAAALNLDLAKVVRVIERSAGDSFVFRRTAPLMISQDFGHGWQNYLMHKDLQLILNIASAKHLRLFLPARAIRIFSRALKLGLGKVDSASIIRSLDG